MAERYDARDLVEPPEKVRRHIRGARGVAAVAAVTAFMGDLFQVHPSFCGSDPCHWSQRSGAIIVLAGTYLAFKSGAVLITWIQTGKQNPVHGINPKQSRDYGWAAFQLLVAGTLIWALKLVPMSASCTPRSQSRTYPGL